MIALASVEQPRVLELPVRHALKKYGRRLSSGELKASRITDSATLRMLREIAKQDVYISAVIVDQAAIIHPPEDAEVIYRQAITRIVNNLIEHYPMVEISIDRRYTNENLHSVL